MKKANGKKNKPSDDGKNHFWVRLLELLALLATILTAYFSYQAASASLKATQIQLQLSQPNLIIKEAFPQSHKESNYSLLIKIKNYGLRPATNLRLVFILIDKLFVSTPNIIKQQFPFDFAPNEVREWETEPFSVPQNLPSQYIIFFLDWHDSKTKSVNSPAVCYMKWEGVVDGKIRSAFLNYATAEEKKEINDYLEKRGILELLIN